MSVVIPCYNNASILAKSLLALARQSLPTDRFEVLVVDDGSTDDTEEVVAALGLPGSFRYIRQSNQGAAVARNRGGSQATGDVLVFLDSDVVPDEMLLDEHLQSHGMHEKALVVGRTRALPAEDGDPFYRTLGAEIFAFDLGDKGQPITALELVSRNFSVKRRSFLEIGRFDEEFPRSGFEDTDFAHRATQLGYQLRYNPRAGGVHHHRGTLSQVSQHMYNYQVSAVLLMKKHPEFRGQIPHLLDKEPIHWGQDGLALTVRKLVRQVLALSPSLSLMRGAISTVERWYPSPSLLRFLYWKVLGSYLLSGFREGVRRYGSPF